jgi:amino acid transporter
MELQRSIGIVGLTFIAVGGIIGSGILFAPLLAAQQAGPAAVVAWLIGGLAAMLLALSFAEVCAMLPVAGGLARLPYLSHGDVVSAAMGWTAWVGYCAAIPVEAEVVMRYAATEFTWLADSGTKLNVYGLAFAFAAMVALVAVNAFGVAVFARVNAALTWIKVGIPVLVAVLFAADRFQVSNFTAAGGFAPAGLEGILAAVSTGGVVFAFFGFRNVVELAGETRNPRVTLPVALGLSIVICLAIYLLVQVTFIGALEPGELDKGWANIEAGHELGPLATIAVGLGMLWLNGVILAGALVSPFGSALVSTGSTSRLAMALGRNGFFPQVTTELSRRHVPLNAMLLNLAVGGALLLFVPFELNIALCSSALVLSLGIGPVMVMSLRRQMAHATRKFRMPFAPVLCSLAFIFATFAVLWAGWDTMKLLLLTIALGIASFAIGHLRGGASRPEFRPAFWLAPYIVGLTVLSWLGTYGGGRGLIPFGWDLLLSGLLGVGSFAWATRSGLAQDQFDERLAGLEDLSLSSDAAGSRD